VRESLAKAVLHNIGVVVVGFGFALLGRALDVVVGWSTFSFRGANALGGVLIALGFLLRVWATYLFYRHEMKVIVREAQQDLLTEGPFRYSRNPLYLGGNVLVFFGAAIVLGSPGAIVLTILNVVAVDRVMIPREERQLAERFGPAWDEYASRVRRWV
jgi:protein-S-isoprenylcysteine O-methyltransferase Ste14